MEEKTEIDEWNNPLAEMSTAYWRNGGFTEYDGCFQVILTPAELITVVSYMMLGMNKVKKITNRGEQ
ncbi:GAD-like domain-containing protein [Enterococcus gallinarum]|uniref:GAD-like domain-containing protein n=1 Tax=Enterococcus gallinarum TaxID=1353 RepID=UPI001C3C4295|nr:GAD-like domain-containing protein [Enterococcus gallinarum]